MDSTLIFTYEIAVRWGDMDALGHVNNAAYFTYMEQARVAWLESIGEVVRRTGQGPVIVSAACDYKRPIVYPAKLQIKMYAGPPGRSSFETRYQIMDSKSPPLLYALGKAQVVWVDHEQGCSMPVPSAIRALLPPSPVPSTGPP
jgi:acyl-CoA thioester hydrolase